MIEISNLQKEYRTNVNAPLAGEADTRSDQTKCPDFTLQGSLSSSSARWIPFGSDKSDCKTITQ